MKNKKIYFNSMDKAGEYLNTKLNFGGIRRNYNVDATGYFVFDVYDNHWVVMEQLYVKCFKMTKKTAKRLIANNIHNLHMRDVVLETDNQSIQPVWVDYVMTGNFGITKRDVRKTIKHTLNKKDVTEIILFNNSIYLRNENDSAEHVICFTTGI